MASTTHPQSGPGQDPAPRPKRRTFTAEYELELPLVTGHLETGT